MDLDRIESLDERLEGLDETQRLLYNLLVKLASAETLHEVNVIAGCTLNELLGLD